MSAVEVVSHPRHAGRAPSPVVVFLAFAFTYFFSALLRAITATLAPVFSAEMGLQAADLGLLAGAFFFGFAATQLPLGHALDRIGPRRTLLAMLGFAVLGCAAFASATRLAELVAARVLIGAGLGACLMAALTCFRQILSRPGQQRANAWMLMSGSTGMVASTLPVQWLLPSLGWRGLFWGLAVMLLLSMVVVAALVPRDRRPRGALVDQNSVDQAKEGPQSDMGYRGILRHPLIGALGPMVFFNYGGLIAVQTLWAGPWLTLVCGWSPERAAQGLLIINLAMLLTFLVWGLVTPRLLRWGLTDMGLMRWGLPLPLIILAVNIASGPEAGALHWAAWCVCTTLVTLSQPAVGAAFAPSQAGRALSAVNLVIFSGVFCIQWSMGLAIDALRVVGWTEVDAFRGTFAAFAVCCVVSYAWFVRTVPVHPHNET